MGGKDGRMRSRVQMHLQSFGITQDPALSAQALLFSLPWLLVLVFHDVIWLPWLLGHAASRQRGWRRTSQLSSPTCFKVDLPVWILSHAHKQCLQPPPSGTLPSEQVTLPDGQPQASQREGDRKILGWELRWGDLGEAVRKWGLPW